MWKLVLEYDYICSYFYIHMHHVQKNPLVYAWAK